MFRVAAASCLIAAAFAAVLPKRAGLAAQAQRGDLRALLAEGPFMRVLVFTTGIQFFLHGPMQLFPLYVRSRGGTMTDLSNLWVCMALLEIPLIFGSNKLFATFGVTRMMLIASAGGGIRWLVCSLVPALSGVYAIQALHALVVTGLNVGTALYVEQIVPERLRSTAQSSVVMVGSSLGGVLSSVIGGVVVDRFGVDTLFMAGGIGALLWAWTGRHLVGEPARSHHV
jgi:PPP family 3-phenylpropionic acid transporter